MLFLLAHNLGKISLNAAFVPAVITVCFTMLSWTVLTFLLKDVQKAGLLVSVFVLLFFSYGHAYRLIGMTGFNLTVAGVSIGLEWIMLPLWVLVFFTCAHFFVRISKEIDNFTRIFNVISTSLVLVSLINLIFFNLKTVGIKLEQRKIKTARLKLQNTRGDRFMLPDIYYIVLDAYANENILRELYGYENVDFLTYLKEKGFYVANESSSNYCQTGLSLASSLNLKYLDDVAKRVGIASYDTEPLKQMIRHNYVFDFLKQYGYIIVAFSSGRSETKIENADVYITPGYDFDESHHAFMNTTPIPEVLKAMGMNDLFDLHRNRILYTLDYLVDTTKMEGPMFVFAHIALPHPPFVFRKDGIAVNPKGRFMDFDADWLIRKGGITRAEYIEGYIDQLRFLNKKLKETIDGILNESKRPVIIVLQSDHGPRSMLVWEDPYKTNFEECMSILNAYYFPDRNYNGLYQDVTPVNTFITIFNRFFGTNKPLLKDKNYFSTASRPYGFVSVTKK